MVSALGLNLNKPLAIVGVIFAAIIGLSLIAAFLPSMFASTASITENVTTGDTGNDQANDLLSVFGFLVPVIIVLGIVGLVIAVASFKK